MDAPVPTAAAGDLELPSSRIQRETIRGHSDRRQYDFDDDLEGISKLHCILSTEFRPLPDTEDERVTREAAGARFPACATSSRNFKRDPVLSERLRDALIYGYQHVGERYENLYRRSAGTNPLTRSEAILFSEELRQLDHVLGHVWTDRTTTETAFFLDRADYYVLIELLEARRAEAKPAFRARQAVLPPLPMWGKNLDYLRYVFPANDFEILGACFRREVEYFLSQLTEYHDFRAKQTTTGNEGHEEIVSRQVDKGKQVAQDLEDPFATPITGRPIPPHLHESVKREGASQSLPRTRFEKDPKESLRTPLPEESVRYSDMPPDASETDRSDYNSRNRPFKFGNGVETVRRDPAKVASHRQPSTHHTQPPARERSHVSIRDVLPRASSHYAGRHSSPRGTASLNGLFKRSRPLSGSELQSSSGEEEPPSRQGSLNRRRDRTHPRRPTPKEEPDPSDSSSDDDEDRRRDRRHAARRERPGGIA
ncbi:hypothetical protein NUW54_g3454 [Trametes sanguinea]|uniref:Uncharacterized protein n=1 Tax=Trametes sanguinea TaxID=158606 RepID=A0ACC1Q0Y2_9APHY|nr:hypothetical protein NUW54_g3454 [Trametes sanguinea]